MRIITNPNTRAVQAIEPKKFNEFRQKLRGQQYYKKGAGRLDRITTIKFSELIDKELEGKVDIFA